MLEHLDGCISWKNPEDAIKQRERIKQQRQQERENQLNNPTDSVIEETDQNESTNQGYTISM